MRWTWGAVLAGLLCASTGCYKVRRLPTTDDAGMSSGAAGWQPDPSQPAERCAGPARLNNPGDALCRAGELEVHCNMGPPRLDCPTSFEEAARNACSGGAESYVTYCNACGGSSIRLPQGAFVFETHFDRADQLLGMTLVHDDPVAPCGQHEFVFGRHCAANSPERVVSCSNVGTTAGR